MKKLNFYRPYATDAILGGCSCGHHGNQSEHDIEQARSLQARGRVQKPCRTTSLKRLLLKHCSRRK